MLCCFCTVVVYCIICTLKDIGINDYYSNIIKYTVMIN